MSYEFKKLDKSYNDALIELASTTNTGSELFRVDRAPNFFALSREFGDTSTFGLFREDRLIACIAVSSHKRTINGKVENVYYLNDLRVHPEYQHSRAYYRLIQHLFTTYTNDSQVTWMFSTVLDSNKNLGLLSNGAKLIQNAKVIGKTVHIGVPVFLQTKRSGDHVSEISGEEAWHCFEKFSSHKNFAPIDKGLFLKENGFFLAVKEAGEVVSICKVVNQTSSRKLRLAKTLPPVFKLLNLFCKLKGCPPLPAIDKEFHHAYLSFYSSKNEQNYRKPFLSFIATHYMGDFTYVFYGVSAEEAAKGTKGIFTTKLSSTTYGYGDVPKGIEVDFHELTLI